MVKWLEISETPGDIMDVMKYVRFPQITADILIDEVLKVPMIYKNNDCRELVLEALRFHTNVFAQPLQEGIQYKPRGEEKMFLISGGIRDETFAVMNTKTKMYGINLEKRNDLKDIDHESEIPSAFALRSLSAVACGHHMFLVGTHNASFNSAALRFDAVTNK